MDLLVGMTTFVRVIESGSLSSAARQLRISTAAASRHITMLEGEVGVKLLARTTRRVTVTSAGQRYYERCLRVLREVTEAQAAAQDQGLNGTLRVSVPVTVGHLGGAALLRPLLMKHPSLRIDLRLDDRVIDLVLEDVDVAIRVASEPPLSTDIVARPLSTWSRHLVAAPSYVRRHGEPKTPAELAGHAALSSTRDAASRWTLMRGTELTRVRMNVRLVSNFGDLLRELAIEGLGVALLPSWYVEEPIRQKRLRRLLPAFTSEPVVVHALYRAVHRNDPRVRLFVEHLRTAYVAAEDPSRFGLQ